MRPLGFAFANLLVALLLLATTSVVLAQNKKIPLPYISEPKPEWIAFVFAGTPRSFIAPAVHESLRYNLIRSLCVAPLCVGDVFVRISASDNNHRGYDAVGVFNNATSAELRQVDDALMRLKMDNGHLYVKRVDIGSSEEREEMLQHVQGKSASDALLHRIYRSLDSRRYSMYFGRYFAYKQVLAQEALNGKPYTWIVHARLDTGWGEPILPINNWSPKKIHAPNSWFADVPDTFALIPRSFGDLYFSLDLLIKNGIICLGGPNFSPKTAEPLELLKLGFTEAESKIVNGELCVVQYPTGYHLIHDKKNNLYWSMSGFSEYFLKRKLKASGVSLDNDNINFYPFFLFIVRAPLGFVCFYLDPQYFLPWVKTLMSAAGGAAAGCYGMHDALFRLRDTMPTLKSCDSRLNGRFVDIIGSGKTSYSSSNGPSIGPFGLVYASMPATTTTASSILQPAAIAAVAPVAAASASSFYTPRTSVAALPAAAASSSSSSFFPGSTTLPTATTAAQAQTAAAVTTSSFRINNGRVPGATTTATYTQPFASAATTTTTASAVPATISTANTFASAAGGLVAPGTAPAASATLDPMSLRGLETIGITQNTLNTISSSSNSASSHGVDAAVASEWSEYLAGNTHRQRALLSHEEEEEEKDEEEERRRRLQDMSVKGHESCIPSLLDGELTDWNFMPFRLRHKSKCVSAGRVEATRKYLNTSDCINYFRKGEFLNQYVQHQLFFFTPMLRGPQVNIYQTLHEDAALFISKRTKTELQ